MGDSQVYEAERRKDGKPAVPTWPELFAGCADEWIKADAQAAASMVPKASDLAARRILAAVWRLEEGRRVWRRHALRRKDLGALCLRLSEDLPALPALFALEKHIAVEAPSDFATLLFLVGELAQVRPKGKRGRKKLPHSSAAFAALRKLKISAADARALLRGVGVPLRRPVAD